MIFIMECTCNLKTKKMGTSNFYNKNANRVYACLMAEQDEESGGIIYPEIWEIDEFKENLRDTIAERCKGNFNYEYEYGDDGERNFYGQFIMTISKMIKFHDWYIHPKVLIILRAGYYSGANLDYEVTFENDWNSDYEDIKSCIKDAFWNSELNEGLRAIHSAKLERKIESVLDELIEFVEKIFEDFTTPLRVVARSSNGATIYEEVK